MTQSAADKNNTASHDADDIDAIITQRRRQAGLPEMRPAYNEADDEEMWK